jgi:hypothetical protein
MPRKIGTIKRVEIGRVGGVGDKMMMRKGDKARSRIL